MESSKQPDASNQRCAGSVHSPLPNRRQALGICSGCALACASSATRALAAFGDPIPVGALKDYTREEISEKFVQHNFFVTRHKGRLFATVATCPHKENYLLRNKKDPKRITCTGHDAVFDPAGKPLSGPVRQGLVRFGIAVDDKGIVRVDPNKQFPESKWNEKGSFIALKTKPEPAGPVAPDPGGELKPEGPTAAETDSEQKRRAAEIEAAKWRTWTTADDKYRLNAKFVKLRSGTLTLEKKNGTTVDVKMDLLCPEDHRFVEQRKWTWSAGKR